MYLNLLKNLNSWLIPTLYADPPSGGNPPVDPPSEDPPAGDPPAGDPPPAAGEMPAGLEDSFWDAEKKEVRLDSLIKSHNDTKAAFSQKEESIRARIVAENQKARPADPTAYQVGELGIDLPEGVSIEFKDNDSFLKTWRTIAFQSNLSQDQFMEGVRSYVTQTLEDRVDVNAEREKLGENAQDRIDRIDLLMSKHLTDEQSEVFAESIMSAAGIEAMEALVTGIAGTRIPDVDGMQAQGKLTKEDIQEMMKDERYWKNPDPAYCKSISDAWERLAAQNQKKAS